MRTQTGVAAYSWCKKFNLPDAASLEKTDKVSESWLAAISQLPPESMQKLLGVLPWVEIHWMGVRLPFSFEIENTPMESCPRLDTYKKLPSGLRLASAVILLHKVSFGTVEISWTGFQVRPLFLYTMHVHPISVVRYRYVPDGFTAMERGPRPGCICRHRSGISVRVPVL